MKIQGFFEQEIFDFIHYKFELFHFTAYSPPSVTLPAVTLPPVRNFAAFFQENMFRATVRNFATRPYLCRFLPVICFFILAGRTYF